MLSVIQRSRCRLTEAEAKTVTIPQMTPLTTALIELDALLEADDVPSVEGAHRVIWDYFSSFDGISEQTKALHELVEAFDRRPSSSPLHSMICKLIAQHRRRLRPVSS
jgi:hypothetical protein